MAADRQTDPDLSSDWCGQQPDAVGVQLTSNVNESNGVTAHAAAAYSYT